MRPVDIILMKRDGGTLPTPALEAFIQGAVSGIWRDYQVAALLMAIVWRGMTPEETACLTHAMVASGVRLDWSHVPGPVVDKHSTGGVGDSTSLILAPLAAACGVRVPMMSGRGLGHTGGTLDKLEAIPGFRVHLNLDDFRAAMQTVGCAMVGQTAEIAPADKLLYALRDVTGTVESIPLITASILSKKIAEGTQGLVMDVKCGRGAFMKTPSSARALAESLVRTGQAAGLRMRALLTTMDAPLGRCVGNALEVRECLEVLRGERTGPLADLSLRLAAEMVHLGGVTSNQNEAHQRVTHALASGQGIDKFRAIIANQGGDARVVDDPTRLPTAPRQHRVQAKRAGYVTSIAAERVGVACMLLGAGRTQAADVVDPAVGMELHVAVGDPVQTGDVLATVHYRDDAKLGQARQLLHEAFELADEPVAPGLIVMDEL